MAEATGDLRAALRGPGDEALVPAAQDFNFLSPGLIPDEVMQAIRASFGVNQP
jgi:hypothetical protein